MDQLIILIDALSRGLLDISGGMTFVSKFAQQYLIKNNADATWIRDKCALAGSRDWKTRLSYDHEQLSNDMH